MMMVVEERREEEEVVEWKRREEGERKRGRSFGKIHLVVVSQAKPSLAR